jgi:hypothetical protein
VTAPFFVFSQGVEMKTVRVLLVVSVVALALGALVACAPAIMPAPYQSSAAVSEPAPGVLLDWESLWPQLQAAGWPGVVTGLAVLVIVYLLAFTDLLKAGWMKRTAVLVLSYLFAGVAPGEVQNALVAAISMVVSTGLKLLLDAIARGIRAEYSARSIRAAQVAQVGKAVPK